MDLKKFVEEENFESGEGLPDGDTFITISEATVTPVEKEYADGVKQKYELKTKDKTYIVGKQVMAGIQAAVNKKPDALRLRITKTGEKLETHYTVVAVME